jgi:hypothetical protein
MKLTTNEKTTYARGIATSYTTIQARHDRPDTA